MIYGSAAFDASEVNLVGAVLTAKLRRFSFAAND